jgi:hypothetical protein
VYNGLPVREIFPEEFEVRDATGESVEEEVRVPLTEGARGVEETVIAAGGGTVIAAGGGSHRVSFVFGLA